MQMQETMLGTTLLWGSVHTVFDAINAAMRVTAQSFALFNVLRSHRNTALIGVLPLVTELFSFVKSTRITACDKGAQCGMVRVVVF